jgi:hypothetical protein
MSILNSSIWHVNCCREPSPAGLRRPASNVPESSDQGTESASHNHQRFSRQGWGLAQSPCTGPIGATLLDRDNIKGSRAVPFPPRMGDRLLRGFVELATELQKPSYLGIEMHSRGASKGSRARIAKRNFGTVESNRASSVERTQSGHRCISRMSKRTRAEKSRHYWIRASPRASIARSPGSQNLERSLVNETPARGIGARGYG